MIQINARDLKIVSQPVIEIRLKIDVYDARTNAHIECSLINGSENINAESDIRRTLNITAVPVKNKRLAVDRYGIIWLNRKIKLQIGIKDRLSREWRWYQQGIFIFADSSAAYDGTTNQITLNCSDLMANLNGTKNGQIGASEISYPAYEEDANTGEVIKYNYIRDAIITTLTQLGKVADYEIDDFGEFKGMPDYNPEYMQYREESKAAVKDGTYMETWNAIPYDQIFERGCSVLSILTAFRDLYPNYEMYFDEYGVFIGKMIPSCYHDDIVFDSTFFDRIYISENTSVDLTTVRNICEVWGQVLDTDFYTEDCTYSNNSYNCNVAEYEEKYCNGDLIAVKIPSKNQAGCSLNVNNFGAIPVVDENTDSDISENLMEAGQVYVFKIKKKRVNNQDAIKAYLLGQWQAHGINVLTDGTISNEDYVIQDGKTVNKYSLEYFQAVYNCKSVELTRVIDSPFCVQELGEVLDVKSGGEYENITSDSLALARAGYENWKNCRLTDSISISTKLCPFADVNIKVSYRRKDINQINQYIVKSVSHDFSSATTDWQLMRFYPLYSDEEIKHGGTWETAADYTWEALSHYTWDDAAILQGRK